MTKARGVAQGLASTFTAAFATLGLLLLALSLFARTDGNGVTSVADHPVMTVLSDSMTPTFRAGDLVVEDPVVHTARLAVGDVITFRTGHGQDLVTHRIVQVNGSAEHRNVTYRTQGDANNASDITPVSPERVVGVYSWRIPYGGYALEAARSQTVMFLLIFILGAALLLPLLVRWWRSAASDVDKRVTPPTERSGLVLSGVRKEGGE